MTETTMTVPAKWTDDCQGKKSFDGQLVSLSTRYWPRGGGFHILDERFASLTSSDEVFPHIKPSATAAIHLDYFDADGDPDYRVLLREDFEGETEANVKGQVEAWATKQYARVVAAMLREFPEVQP